MIKKTKINIDFIIPKLFYNIVVKLQHMNYGPTIKKYRDERRLTQQQLGDLVGVTQAAIGFYEQGKREPDAQTLKNIAISLDVPLPILVWYSIEVMDVPFKKRAAFKLLKSKVDNLIYEFI